MTLASRGDSVRQPVESAGPFVRPWRNVVLVGPHPPPFGGPGVHMLHLRQALEARGATCAVMSIWSSDVSSEAGVYQVRSGLGYCARMTSFVRRGYHVHHLFNVESPKAIILAAVAAVLTRALRGSYSIGFIGGPRQRLLDRRIIPWSTLFRFSLRTASFVVCNNPEVADALEKAGAPRSCVHPIPVFHAEQVADVGEPDTATRQFMARCDPVLCAIVHPRFETERPHHEMELLLGALQIVARRLPNIGCVVMGGAAYVPHYERMARASGHEKRLHFTGELAHRDCLGVMAASAVFVRAYLKDGTSSSVRESLALGTPAVVSRNSQHPRAACQFSPDDASDLAAQLLRTLEDLPLVRQQLAAGSILEEAGGIERELMLFPRMGEPTRKRP